jgi:hypothetical protein
MSQRNMNKTFQSDLHIDATFQSFVQGDLSVNDY